MKRIILGVAAALALGATASAQVQLETFQDAFETFAGDMAGVLAVNSTIGNDWSTAYVGGFPRFGVGVAAGANFVPAASLEPLLQVTGTSLPAELEQYGLPIPAAAATFKIGLPLLRMDVGVKGGVIPEAASGALSGMGIDATYQVAGVSVRYAILRDRILIPAVSIGASWNYVKGSLAANMGIGDQSFGYTVSGAGSYDGDYTINLTDPSMDLEWEANTFDFTLQVSKNLLIFTPYAGAGLTIGMATTSGGMASSVTVDKDGSPATSDQIAALEEAAGITISDQGFLVSASATAPTVRLYGGTSINLLVLRMDFMASYVPLTNALGAQVMARLQL